MRQQSQPHVLRDVGVLVFVHQNIFELRVKFAQHIRIFLEQSYGLGQQITKVAGIEDFKPILILPVEFASTAISKRTRVTLTDLIGCKALVFPLVDQARKGAGRPAFVVNAFGANELFQKPDLVVSIEDRKIGLEIDEFGVAAQDFHSDGMEGAEPRHSFDRFTDHPSDALLHLAGRLVGEGYRKNLTGIGASRRQDMGNPGRKNPRLAGTGTRQNKQRAIERLNRFDLLRIQALEIVDFFRGEYFCDKFWTRNMLAEMLNSVLEHVEMIWPTILRPKRSNQLFEAKI